jgi:hypothetical protein
MFPPPKGFSIKNITQTQRRLLKNFLYYYNTFFCLSTKRRLSKLGRCGWAMGWSLPSLNLKVKKLFKHSEIV